MLMVWLTLSIDLDPVIYKKLLFNSFNDLNHENSASLYSMFLGYDDENSMVLLVMLRILPPPKPVL